MSTRLLTIALVSTIHRVHERRKARVSRISAMLAVEHAVVLCRCQGAHRLPACLPPSLPASRQAGSPLQPCASKRWLPDHDVNCTQCGIWNFVNRHFFCHITAESELASCNRYLRWRKQSHVFESLATFSHAPTRVEPGSER